MWLVVWMMVRWWFCCMVGCKFGICGVMWCWYLLKMGIGLLWLIIVVWVNLISCLVVMIRCWWWVIFVFLFISLVWCVFILLVVILVWWWFMCMLCNGWLRLWNLWCLMFWCWVCVFGMKWRLVLICRFGILVCISSVILWKCWLWVRSVCIFLIFIRSEFMLCCWMMILLFMLMFMWCWVCYVLGLNFIVCFCRMRCGLRCLWSISFWCWCWCLWVIRVMVLRNLIWWGSWCWMFVELLCWIWVIGCWMRIWFFWYVSCLIFLGKLCWGVEGLCCDVLCFGLFLCVVVGLVVYGVLGLVW